MDVVPERIPQVLKIGVKSHILSQLPAVALDSAGLTQADGFIRPLEPALHAEVALYSHIEGVVFQPLVFLAESFHRVTVPGIALLEGLAQNAKAGVINFPVVHIPGLRPPICFLNVRGVQQTVFCQQIQIDKIRVSGKGGKALIRAVAKARGAQGQHLPAALAGG